MISRRNIRVKVMQTLYSLEWYSTFSTEELGVKNKSVLTNHRPIIGEAEVVEQGRKLLKQHLGQTSKAFVYLLYFLGETARYAEIDARMRASRHLPSKADLNVNTKIAGNPILWRMLDDPGFKSRVEQEKLSLITDRELIKKTYDRLALTPEYQEYAAAPSREEAKEKAILLFIFNSLMVQYDIFDQHMDDLFLCWTDDKEMMNVLVQNYFQKPHQFNFLQLISPEKNTYAFELMQTSIEKKGYCLDMIFPKLKNWDPERIAAIDMLLMVMCVCEFIYFPTIPTKVSINEYIDLAKAYSTQQSGQFVNGILDNILKDLMTGEKILKTAHVKK